MLSASELRARARGAGFHLTGFAPLRPLDPGPLDRWLARGFAADMDWMGRRRDERLDPRRLLPEARAAMALAVCHAREEHRDPSPVASYARGRDYHYVLRGRLRRLRRAIFELAPGLPTYGSIDFNPVMEKAWAEACGLGFIGKNGLLIAPGFGSQLLLAVLFLGDEVDVYDAPMARQCGECVLCLEACPTGAIPEPGVVDARRCLSYQTIENAGPVPAELRPGFAGTVFGCDLCQTCCPWNARPAPAQDTGFAPRPLARLTARDFAALSPEAYQALIPGSALARAGYHGLRRNALLALGAQRDASAIDIVRTLVEDPEPMVREAAAWALGQIEGG